MVFLTIQIPTINAIIDHFRKSKYELKNVQSAMALMSLNMEQEVDTKGVYVKTAYVPFQGKRVSR